jgi:hypothetical protein
VDDEEKTAISKANMVSMVMQRICTCFLTFIKLQSNGKAEEALEVLTQFTNKYSNESDTLMGWRQARARILRQTSRKR